MKKFVRLFSVSLITVVVGTATISVVDNTFKVGTQTAYAENLDDVNSNNGSGYDALSEVQNKQKQDSVKEKQSQNKAINGDSNQSVSEILDTSDVDSPQGNYFQKFFPMNDDSINNASTLLSPVSKFVATAISVVLFLIFLFIGLVTALDIFYIFIPPVRSMLAPQNSQPQQNGMGGFGGGGFGMGGMGGMNQQQQKPRMQVVSDECLQAMAEGGQQQAQGGINGGMTGMGGFGMGGMGGMNQQQMSNRSIAWLYLKKRVIALVFLGVMAVVLLSSFFTDFGLNIGMMFLKLANSITG